MPVVFEAGFFISQISQQVAKHLFAELMDVRYSGLNCEIWDGP